MLIFTAGLSARRPQISAILPVACCALHRGDPLSMPLQAHPDCLSCRLVECEADLRNLMGVKGGRLLCTARYLKSAVRCGMAIRVSTAKSLHSTVSHGHRAFTSLLQGLSSGLETGCELHCSRVSMQCYICVLHLRGSCGHGSSFCGHPRLTPEDKTRNLGPGSVTCPQILQRATLK